MTAYESGLKLMEELFGRDFQFSLATVCNAVPSIRVIDTYYYDEAFWVVTYGKSKKVTEIEANPHVALCHNLYSFTGEAYNVGHPLKPENQAIRSKLIKAFEPWYFLHNNEADENMCYIKIDLKSGFLYKDGIGYKLDFVHKAADEFPFESDVLTIN